MGSTPEICLSKTLKQLVASSYTSHFYLRFCDITKRDRLRCVCVCVWVCVCLLAWCCLNKVIWMAMSVRAFGWLRYIGLMLRVCVCVCVCVWNKPWISSVLVQSQRLLHHSYSLCSSCLVQKSFKLREWNMWWSRRWRNQFDDRNIIFGKDINHEIICCGFAFIIIWFRQSCCSLTLLPCRHSTFAGTLLQMRRIFGHSDGPTTIAAFCQQNTLEHMHTHTHTHTYWMVCPGSWMALVQIYLQWDQLKQMMGEISEWWLGWWGMFAGIARFKFLHLYRHR